MNQEHFIDYYEILQVSRNADPETIERIFRLLAKRYHPDNTRTGNSERFSALTEAYQVLAHPEKRAEYDARYESDRQNQWRLFFETPMSGVDEDRRIQQWVLSLLYTTRRRSSSDPGVGVFELEKVLDVAEGQLEFHLWYLKEKGWIMRTESGKYAITVDGVDWIAEKDRLLRSDRLLEEGGNSDFAKGPSRSSMGRDPGSFPPQRKALPREEPTQQSD
jgi:curved DNA-binding protein CbpA